MSSLGTTTVKPWLRQFKTALQLFSKGEDSVELVGFERKLGIANRHQHIYVTCEVLIEPAITVDRAHAIGRMAGISFFQCNATLSVDGAGGKLLFFTQLKHLTVEHLMSAVESLLNLSDTWECILKPTLSDRH